MVYRWDSLLMDRRSGYRISGVTALANTPFLSGECPTMYKVAFGRLEVFLGFKQAHRYLETAVQGASKILVTPEIDWSWTRILEYFEGVITDQGTRVSRAAEVLTLMNKPGVLGTKKATEILRSGAQVHIVCDGNAGSVYVVNEKPW
jgi:phosphoenolpyruvate synthase/pyruvate phosphate dikinase